MITKLITYETVTKNIKNYKIKNVRIKNVNKYGNNKPATKSSDINDSNK